MQDATRLVLSASGFRWLHFSDVHMGMKGQTSLWPRFGTTLLDELPRTLRDVGVIDVVIFSGDLVQMGSAEEFAEFEVVIAAILDRIGQVQDRPKLITVPGNHDLVRPSPMDPAARALKEFWSASDLRAAIFEKDGLAYRDFLVGVFKNYSEWQTSAIEKGLHLAKATAGILPGDAAYVLETAAGRLGVAGLNSTWLQLGAGDYLGQLHVDAKQLHAITDAQPDAWTRANDANILLTHQPPKWLHPTQPASWENDINPPGRFDLHLFGHMHEPDVGSRAFGGGLSQRSVQAASLFGLEKFGDDNHQRIQGYSTNLITLSGDQRSFTCWPRRLVALGNGTMKLAPDSSQDIDEDTKSFTITYGVERQGIVGNPVPTPLRHPSANSIDFSPSIGFDLSAIRFTTGPSAAHVRVRRLEQETAVHSLRNERVVWIASDWGMGHEGFIASICMTLAVPLDRVYALDLSAFSRRAEFFDEIQVRLGVGFQQVCESLADAGPSLLIFDQVDISPTSLSEGAAWDLEGLARTVADFAPEAFIIIKSRKEVPGTSCQTVELKSLDEADIGIYAGDSELGASSYAKPEAAAKLYRHTDGIPSRLDDALRDLEMISLDDLLASNSDLSNTGGGLVEAPAALVATVSSLRGSDERSQQRAYSLLLALSALPKGEQLSRLKRFLGPHPFGTMHARPLLDRSLIDTVPLTTLEAMSEGSTTKALVVPRPVREYIRDVIDDQTAREIDLKVLDLYFGDKWAIGDIHNSPTGRRVRQPLCDGYEIQNAIVLILRTTRRALDSGTELDVENAIRLSFAFISVLRDGDHFRSAASLCEDMLRLLEGTTGHEADTNHLRYNYARSLRMIGKVDEARANFEQLDQELLTNHQKQHAGVGLALCYEREGKLELASKAAQNVIKIDSNTSQGLHAKIILADQIQDSAERERTLRRHLATARRKDNNVLANNILITLAADARVDGKQSDDLLKEVLQSTKGSADFYNAARAIVEYANLPGAAAKLTLEEKTRLIEAYHFLYNERLYSLFDRCHEALWKVFELEDNQANLLNLFRHTSFIWRLNGREDQEMRYLLKLAKRVRSLIAGGLSQASRDGAYYVVRITVTGTLPNYED